MHTGTKRFSHSLCFGTIERYEIGYGFIGATMINSLAELQQLTTEVHAVEIDAAVFAPPATVPATPFPALAPPDLRPAGNGAAIDQGVALPGVNTGFAGAAPDLGAYEAGAALPPYGPR